MSCSIYCLVSRLEQIQPLMARVSDAGVPREHVTMIFRSGDYWLSQRAQDLQEPAAGASMWDAPFVSMALWWELASVGLSATQGPDDGEADLPRCGAIECPRSDSASHDCAKCDAVIVAPGVFASRRKDRNTH